MRKTRLAKILAVLPRRVRHVVVGVAADLVAPDVEEIEPVADFMGRGAAAVERRRGRARGAEGVVDDGNAVGGGQPAGELRIAEQRVRAVHQFRTDPYVEIARRVPGVVATLRRELHGVVGTKFRNAGLGARDTGGRLACGILAGQHEFHEGVGRQRLERRRHF